MTAITDSDVFTAAPSGPPNGGPRSATLMRGYLGEINNRVRWMYNRLASIFGAPTVFTAANVDTGTDRITITGHGLVTNDVIRYANVGGTAISVDLGSGGSPLQLSEDFSPIALYAIAIDANTIQLSLTSGGAALDITAAGADTHYFYKVPSALAAPMYRSFLVGSVTIIAGTLVNQMRQFLPLAGGTVTGTVTVDSGTGALSFGGTKRVTYASRSLTRVQKAPLVNVTLDTAASVGLSVQKGDIATQDLAFPNGATLTGITVYHNRTNTGTLPTTRLQIGIKKVLLSSGVASDVLAATEDPEAVLANYEAHHAIAITGLSEVIDNTAYKYYLNVNGEVDPNGATTSLFPAITTVTMTSDDEHP